VSDDKTIPQPVANATIDDHTGLWTKAQQEAAVHAITDSGIVAHLPTGGTLLLYAAAIGDEPPSLADLARHGLCQMPHGGDPWQDSCWEEPHVYTHAELVSFKDFDDDDEPVNVAAANAEEIAGLRDRQEASAAMAAHHGMPSLRTWDDLFRLIVVAGLLTEIPGPDGPRYRLTYPMPDHATVLPPAATSGEGAS